MSSFSQNSGMSLLEVMIAVVVFSVGLIGVAALMLTSMRNNDATLARTQSTMLANEMYEKILANLPVPGVTDNIYTKSTLVGLPSASKDCYMTPNPPGCNTTELANWDLEKWAGRVNQVLVGSDAAIAVNTTVDPMIIQISIQFEALMETEENVIDDETYTTETFTFRAR